MGTITFIGHIDTCHVVIGSYLLPKISSVLRINFAKIYINNEVVLSMTLLFGIVKLSY